MADWPLTFSRTLEYNSTHNSSVNTFNQALLPPYIRSWSSRRRRAKSTRVTVALHLITDPNCTTLWNSVTEHRPTWNVEVGGTYLTGVMDGLFSFLSIIVNKKSVMCEWGSCKKDSVHYLYISSILQLPLSISCKTSKKIIFVVREPPAIFFFCLLDILVIAPTEMLHLW